MIAKVHAKVARAVGGTEDGRLTIRRTDVTSIQIVGVATTHATRGEGQVADDCCFEAKCWRFLRPLALVPMDYRPWLSGLHEMRDAVLDRLTDSDLDWSPGGTNPAWRALLESTLSMQCAYLESFRSGVMSFDHHEIAATTLAEFQAEFSAQDDALDSILFAYGDAELAAIVKRPDLSRTGAEQAESYVQFMLIVLAKASVFLRVLGREIPASVESYVG